MDFKSLLKSVEKSIGKEIRFSLRELRQLLRLKEDIEHLQEVLERASDDLISLSRPKLLQAYYLGKSKRDLRHIQRIEKRLDLWVKRLEALLVEEESSLSPRERQMIEAFKGRIEICKNTIVRICAPGGELQTLLDKPIFNTLTIKKKIDEALGDETAPGVKTLLLLSQQLERYTGVFLAKSQQKILEEDKSPQFEAGYLRVGGKRYDIRRKMPHQLTADDRSRMDIDEERLAKAVGTRRYSVLHTHPRTKQQAKKFPSFQSDLDILDFLGRLAMRTCIVAQRDPITGKVAGYFFLRRTWRTPTIPPKPLDNEKGYREWLGLAQVRRLLKDLQEVYASWPEGESFETLQPIKAKERRIIHAAFLLFCKRYHLRFRAVPVKGYTYKDGAGFVSRVGK